MYRIRITNKELGLKVEQIDINAETETEAKEWAKSQMSSWGVPIEKISESLLFEKLELLLETK